MYDYQDILLKCLQELSCFQTFYKLILSIIVFFFLNIHKSVFIYFGSVISLSWFSD